MVERAIGSDRKTEHFGKRRVLVCEKTEVSEAVLVHSKGVAEYAGTTYHVKLGFPLT